MKRSIWGYLLVATLLSACAEDYSLANYAEEEAALLDPDGEFTENPFVIVEEEPTSTFSVDADGGSYVLARRSILEQKQMPDANDIRIEEFINYFPLDYSKPEGEAPIALNGEISTCPWATENLLMRVGIQGRDIPVEEWQGSNIVLLIDVSGSMNGADRLGLLQYGFKKMVESFNPGDRIAIVTYAGNSGVHLESTNVAESSKIIKAIDDLSSGGSTNGADGIITAYEIAQQHFIEGGNNRVILGTDGDFNVGITNQDELIALIEEKREQGVFLTTVGVGNGNYQDGQLEQIANHGNGTYEYIWNEEQAEKVFVHEFKKLLTVAKDVKVQVHFDPNQIKAYRLIGYENRLLDNEDFLDDTEDAGEIGANQNVTALYELIPATSAQEGAPSFTIDFRYKEPDAASSEPLELTVPFAPSTFQEASENHRFVSAVAAYGMLLRNSEYAGSATFTKVLDWAQEADNYDPFGYRAAFKQLIMATMDL